MAGAYWSKNRDDLDPKVLRILGILEDVPLRRNHFVSYSPSDGWRKHGPIR